MEKTKPEAAEAATDLESLDDTFAGMSDGIEPPDPLKLAGEIADLDTEIAELNGRAEAKSKERESLAELLLELMGESGTQRLNINGRTIYIHRELWASVPAANVGDFLALPGCSELGKTTINSQTASAHIRELARTEEGDYDIEKIPAQFRELAKVSMKVSLRSRKD